MAIQILAKIIQFVKYLRHNSQTASFLHFSQYVEHRSRWERMLTAYQIKSACCSLFRWQTKSQTFVCRSLPGQCHHRVTITDWLRTSCEPVRRLLFSSHMCHMALKPDYYLQHGAQRWHHRGIDAAFKIISNWTYLHLQNMHIMSKFWDTRIPRFKS